MTDLALVPEVPQLPASSGHIPALIGPPDPGEWELMLTVCDRLAKSTLVPKDLRGKPSDILVIALTARELRLGMMTALNKIHVIEGKPSMSAELMTALIQRDGHMLTPVRLDEHGAIIKYRRRDWPEGEWGEYEFNRRDAINAGLLDLWFERWYQDHNQKNRKETWVVPGGAELGRENVVEQVLKELSAPEWVIKQGVGQMKMKDNWWHYAKSMYWARAVSQIGRMAFADVLMGVSYTPEEMGFDIDPATGEPLDNMAPQEQRDDLIARARSLPPSLGAELRAWAQDVQAPPLNRVPLRWVAAWESAIEQRESFVVNAHEQTEPEAPAESEPVSAGEEGEPPTPEPEPVPEPPTPSLPDDDAASSGDAAPVPAEVPEVGEDVPQTLPLAEPGQYPEALKMAWMMPVEAVARLEKSELVAWCDLLGIPSAGSNADRAQRIMDAKPFVDKS